MKSAVHAIVVASCLISMAVLCRGGGGSQQSVSPLIITTASLPNGTAETVYSQTSKVGGGDIGVTLTPGDTGSLNGTLSVTDSATDSPQTVALSRTGMSGGALVTGKCATTFNGHFSFRTGVCTGKVGTVCKSVVDHAQCPPGLAIDVGVNSCADFDVKRSCTLTSSFSDRMNADKLQ